MSSKTHLGLEINDKEIRYLELSKDKGVLALGRYGEIKLGAGIIRNGSIEQGIMLLDILTALNKKEKWKDVTVAQIPQQVYLVDILLEAGFKNIYFESAGEALARIAIPQDKDETDMIVYFAGGKMDIYIGARESAELLSTINFSSDLFWESKDTEIINSFIREKIDEQYISWHTHKDKGGKNRQRIEKIVLAGEIRDPEELSGYLSKSLKVRTELIDAWQNIFSLKDHIPEINFRSSLRYAAAIGLAFRTLEK